MNFLGHFYLAGNNEHLIIGNFIADFVKGKSYLDYPDEIAEGILMHREIDEFTDNHPAFKETKKRLVETQGHFSGVVVDVFYDHFLALDFEKIAQVKLSKFAQKMYAIIDRYHSYLPERCQFLFRYMKRDNWLLRYRQMEGINWTLTGMSRRVKFDNNMGNAIEELEAHYAPIQADFRRFINDAQKRFK